MEKIVHDLVQASAAWDEFRLNHFGASEIAAVLGLSKKTTRTELLRAKKTGIAKEFGIWLRENVLERGHEIEALARPLAVEFAGVDGFYPVTTSLGRISASCDGIDMLDETTWECKSLNAQNGPIVRAGDVPEEHMPQCQQVLMVTGAERLLFTVSDGTRDGTFHTWVEPDTAWFDRIRAGWTQFAIDLETHEPVEATIAPVGRAPDSLPALHIVLRGEVSASNLAEFKEVALTAIRSVNRDLQTDQDFADSAKARKWCSDIETRVAAAKEHALSQTATIDMLFRTMDEVSAEAREVRLSLEKLEKARTESRKGEIVAGGVKGLADHIRALHERLGNPYMPATPVDFGGAIKGMRSFDSMKNAVDTALANAKIAANATADRIDVNLKHLNTEAADFLALFPDVATLVLKDPQDFAAQVQTRVAAQRVKDEQRAEAQRQRIAEEERVKAEAKARAEAEEQRRAEAAAVAAQQAAQVVQTAAAPPPAAAPAPAPTSTAVTPLRETVTSTSTAAPAADAAPTLSVGQIGTRLGFAMPAAFLESLGFEPTRHRGSVLFHESEFEPICQALIEHIQSVIETQAA